MARVNASVTIPGSADAVWELIREFDALAAWHPAVADSRIEGERPGDAVGCVRRLELTDGAVLREQLVALSDEERAVAYRMLDSPLPVDDYLAELRLTPATLSGDTFAQWWARFEVPPAEEADTVATVRGVFEGGLDSLRARFASG